MLDRLSQIDRRWIFLLMFLAVAIPVLLGLQFPEKPTALAEMTFAQIEQLEPGDRVLLSFDFDPASEGELGPMATAFVRHCCEKRLKMYFMALWPVGPQMIDDTIDNVIRADFPELAYGVDYVNLGFKSGQEGVIKVIVTDLRKLYTTDARGTNIDQIPMMKGFENVQDSDLVINISAGYPGTKEWVQFASTPYPDEITVVAGVTGVQAPLFYPYIPEQLPGLLGAIKGAAEYEALVVAKYGGPNPDPRYLEALRRMGPQLVTHLLMIGLIIAGNAIFFAERRRGRPRLVGTDSTQETSTPRAKRDGLIWAVLLIAGAGFLGYRALTAGIGTAYVQRVGDAESSATPAEGAAEVAEFSLPRSVGIWVAAILTLCIFSFLYRDNPFYKVAEALVVGVSAGYWMVVGFWDVIVPNLLANLFPEWIQSWAMPGITPVREETWWLNAIPLVLGVMLLWRLFPRGAWVSRWPLAFIIGATAGLRLVGYIQADFLGQIRNSIVPLVVTETLGRSAFWVSLDNILLTVSVLACLVYFFFSVEHKGAVGGVSRVGIWVLMITFGAAFGYTVMGRIALLAIRLEFLFDDWLWLIDPTRDRLGV